MFTVFHLRAALHVTSAVSTVLITRIRIADHVFTATFIAILFTGCRVLRAFHVAAMSRRALLHAFVRGVAMERALLAIPARGITHLGTQRNGPIGGGVVFPRQRTILVAIVRSLTMLNTLLLLGKKITRSDFGVNRQDT